MRNNLLIPSSGQQGVVRGESAVTETNITAGGESLLLSATGDLDFHLDISANAAIDQGTSSGAPSDDIGFDWQCITQQDDIR